MTCKLLRRPLPPLKADLAKDQYLNNPTGKQVPDQNTLALNLNGDLSNDDLLQEQDDKMLPLPPNSSPTQQRAQLNTPEEAAGVFINVSRVMFHQNSLKTAKYLNSWSQFPHRPYRKQANQGSLISRLYKEETQPLPPANNGINDFISKVSKKADVSTTYAKRIVYSKHTYCKIAERCFRQNSEDKHLNIVDIRTEDLGEVPKRIPQKQLLIELTALIKEHIRETMKIDIQTAIKPLPRFKFGAKKHLETEIILYPQAHPTDSPTRCIMKRDIDRVLQENCLASGEPKFFQGGKRTQTPFCISDESMATPTEIAILDAIFNGGQILNLKAHFISDIPDISFLKDRLTSLNLSFNSFVTLPDAVLRLQNLETLKVRDNPLREIPDAIGNLKNLRTLIISFCLLSTFPPKFFELEMLQILDVSYNNLDHIPSQISHLRFLQELSLEGNQLTILPASILSLDLHFLSLKNNFLHHLFWKMTKKFYMEKNSAIIMDENSSAASCNPTSPTEDLPEEQSDSLADNLLGCCFNCDAAIKSNSLYHVQIHRNVFGHAALIFLYEVCSLSCLEDFY